MDWEWFTDHNVYKLFTYLIMKANWKDSAWRGHQVKRGQVLTGRILLAKETGLSQSQVRTALTKLKSTNDIAIRATNKFSIITITNYDNYQKTERKRPATSPTRDQQSTTSNNLNNINNITNTVRAKIFDYLNKKTDKNFTGKNKNHLSAVNARLNEGFVFEDFKYVIDVKTAAWKNTDMEQYLRPSTLFGNKFESYRNESESSVSKLDKELERAAKEADSTEFYNMLRGVGEN